MKSSVVIAGNLPLILFFGFVCLFISSQHFLNMVFSGSTGIGHVVLSGPGSLCRGGGDSSQHRH